MTHKLEPRPFHDRTLDVRHFAGNYLTLAIAALSRCEVSRVDAQSTASAIAVPDGA